MDLGFFSDVFIPKYSLPSVSAWEAAESVWVWDFEGNPMYLDEGEAIRVRVSSVQFNAVPRRDSGQVHILPHRVCCNLFVRKTVLVISIMYQILLVDFVCTCVKFTYQVLRIL